MLMPRLSIQKSSPRRSKASDSPVTGICGDGVNRRCVTRAASMPRPNAPGPQTIRPDELVDPAALKLGLLKRDVGRARKRGSGVLSGQASQIHAGQLPAETRPTNRPAC